LKYERAFTLNYNYIIALLFKVNAPLLEGIYVPGLNAFEKEVAQLIVENLNLTIVPEDMEPDIPLFNEGLGLDSIDALELSLAISQKYGINIRSDDKNINHYFSSLRALSKYIHEKKSLGDVENK
jgi:acyl carrier protein